MHCSSWHLCLGNPTILIFKNKFKCLYFALILTSFDLDLFYVINHHTYKKSCCTTTHDILLLLTKVHGFNEWFIGHLL